LTCPRFHHQRFGIRRSQNGEGSKRARKFSSSALLRRRVGEGFQFLVRGLKMVARLKKIAFGAPPHGGEQDA
jgi:hypothetical protein